MILEFIDCRTECATKSGLLLLELDGLGEPDEADKLCDSGRASDADGNGGLCDPNGPDGMSNAGAELDDPADVVPEIIGGLDVPEDDDELDSDALELEEEADALTELEPLEDDEEAELETLEVDAEVELETLEDDAEAELELLDDTEAELELLDDREAELEMLEDDEEAELELVEPEFVLDKLALLDNELGVDAEDDEALMLLLLPLELPELEDDADPEETLAEAEVEAELDEASGVVESDVLELDTPEEAELDALLLEDAERLVLDADDTPLLLDDADDDKKVELEALAEMEEAEDPDEDGPLVTALPEDVADDEPEGTARTILISSSQLKRGNEPGDDVELESPAEVLLELLEMLELLLET